MRTLDLFRPSVGAFAIGMARKALELATEYAQAAAHVQQTAQGPPGRLAPTRGRSTAKTTPPACSSTRQRTAHDARHTRPGPGRDGEAARDRDGPGGGRRRGPVPRRQSRSSTATRSSTSTATSARPGSTRAPPRSSGRSSPGACSQPRTDGLRRLPPSLGCGGHPQRPDPRRADGRAARLQHRLGGGPDHHPVEDRDRLRVQLVELVHRPAREAVPRGDDGARVSRRRDRDGQARDQRARHDLPRSDPLGQNSSDDQRAL